MVLSDKQKQFVELAMAEGYTDTIDSKGIKELQQKYIQIINSGDANLLVVFLSQHPYHIDGLLQLALIFAKIGHMDRSSDLVRRSLYFLECACVEKFKVSIVCLK